METNEITAGRDTISVTTVADCPFSVADEYAKEYLERAEAGGREAAVRGPWPRLPFSRRVRFGFSLHLDVTEGGRRHDEIRFHWASGTRLLPDFHGTLAFRIEQSRTRIIVSGDYRVPLGAFGRWFDRRLGRRIAYASVRNFAERLAADLEARERAWRTRVSR